MSIKFVTICTLVAIVNAGGLVHPITYTQFHNVAVAHPSADEAHQIHHQTHYSHGPEGSHIHYIPAYAKTVHIGAPVPVHSGPAYVSPTFTHHVAYGPESFGRSLSFNEEPSSTVSTHTSEETTTAEPKTTESTTPEPKTTEETSHTSKSDDPEPTQASFPHKAATSSSGYKYDAPSATSSGTHTSGVPTFIKFHAGDHHVAVPSVVKYEVPAQTIVKYAAPAPHQTLVHYPAPLHAVYHKAVAPAPVHAVYHKTVAPAPIHVKYASPEPAVYTSFGEHAPAVYSHGPASTVHHAYAAPHPGFIKYGAPEPGQVAYVAPAVYTKYGIPESSSKASHVLSAPSAFIKYGSPAVAPISHTTYLAPQHSSDTLSTKLIKYDGPEFHAQSDSSNESQSTSSSDEENKDSVEVKSPESITASIHSSRAYLPPATHFGSHTYQDSSESAKSNLNEHNIWSTDGATSHVSFKGFGTSYGY